MKAYNRVNTMNRRYTLVELSDGRTQIRLRNPEKDIIVNHDIERLNQAWYDWTAGGKLIQNAFPFLNADEREFLKTGLTVDEWNELFNLKKKVN